MSDLDYFINFNTETGDLAKAGRDIEQLTFLSRLYGVEDVQIVAKTDTSFLSRLYGVEGIG